MIRPDHLKNMMVPPEDLEHLDAAPGEHAEIPRRSCVEPGQQTNDAGDPLTPAHEWRENCEDRGDDEDEPEAS